MLQDFFKDLTLPSFLQSAFEKEEWYLVTAQLIEILNNSITQTELNSGDET